MIRYSLVCSNGHEFEGWFGSSGDFDSQRERMLVACPDCGVQDVEKALMAPSVRGGRDERTAVAGDASADRNVATLDQHNKQMLEKIRELRKAIVANTEDVGTRFGEEARKIHYGDAEARGIRGQAPREEAARLIEEGIDIMPLPELPEDRN